MSGPSSLGGGASLGATADPPSVGSWSTGLDDPDGTADRRPATRLPATPETPEPRSSGDDPDSGAPVRSADDRAPVMEWSPPERLDAPTEGRQGTVEAVTAEVRESRATADVSDPVDAVRTADDVGEVPEWSAPDPGGTDTVDSSIESAPGEGDAEIAA